MSTRPIQPFPTDPHAGQPVLAAGPAPEEAPATLILLHGRGASAQDILSLYAELDLPALAALAAQAAGHSWYPRSFLAPLAANEPYLSSALRGLEALVADLARRGVPAERVALLGFSQGACLALEFAARHARRYGGVIAFTGGLIGPPGTARDYAGSLAGTPMFLGAGDPDLHVPFARVQESADVLARMGARVDLHRYPGLPHTINEDELAAGRALLHELLAKKGPP